MNRHRKENSADNTSNISFNQHYILTFMNRHRKEKKSADNTSDLSLSQRYVLTSMNRSRKEISADKAK
jgi:hypothetical protein